MEEKRLLVIADVHGDFLALERLLDRFGIVLHSYGATMENRPPTWTNPHNYFVVFLGDLNDPRMGDPQINRQDMSSWECLRIARSLHSQGISETVHSNHQQMLLDYWHGHTTRLAYGMEYTVEEMVQMQDKPEGYGFKDKADVLAYQTELMRWLAARPYFYLALDQGSEQQVVCTHAFYTPGMDQYQPTYSESLAAIWGPNRHALEYSWWLQEQHYLPDILQVVGHYHDFGLYPSTNPRAVLVDGNCGSPGGELLAFTPGSMTFHTNKSSFS